MMNIRVKDIQLYTLELKVFFFNFRVVIKYCLDKQKMLFPAGGLLV